MRWIIGYSNLTSSYLLLDNNVPPYPSCNISLSIGHILIECPLYNAARKAWNLINNLGIILGNTSQGIISVLSFVRR